MPRKMVPRVFFWGGEVLDLRCLQALNDIRSTRIRFVFSVVYCAITRYLLVKGNFLRFRSCTIVQKKLVLIVICLRSIV